MNNLSELLQSTDVIPGLEVLDRLGGGRDSDVYAIRKEGQLFALKLQKSKGEQDIDARRKKGFLKEAAYLACMRHPSLPKVYESGDFHGRAYMIMELVQGPTLRKRLGQGPIRENELIPLARDIAGALAEAHAQGLIHRDVKPENIILQEKHPAKLLDFGLPQAGLGMLLREIILLEPSATALLNRLECCSDRWMLAQISIRWGWSYMKPSPEPHLSWPRMQLNSFTSMRWRILSLFVN